MSDTTPFAVDADVLAAMRQRATELESTSAFADFLRRVVANDVRQLCGWLTTACGERDEWRLAYGCLRADVESVVAAIDGKLPDDCTVDVARRVDRLRVAHDMLQAELSVAVAIREENRRLKADYERGWRCLRRLVHLPEESPDDGQDLLERVGRLLEAERIVNERADTSLLDEWHKALSRAEAAEAERRCTLAVLDLPASEVSGLDSLVSEALAQKDNELAELRQALHAAESERDLLHAEVMANG